MTTFAEQFEKKFKANQAGQSSFAQRFETEGAGARILEEYRRRQEEAKRRKPIETSRQQLDQSLAQYDEATSGIKGWLNKFLGRGTSAPVLVGETPEYTQARQQSEEGVKSGPVKRTVDFFTSGARESAFDVVYQRKLDKENLQRMDDNNRKIIDYTNKINQASGNTKARLEKLRQIYVDQNSQIAQDVGGELKNKTNAQLFGQSVETALDLTPFLGFQSILTNLGTRGVAKVAGKQAAKSLLGKKATSSLGKEAIKEGALFGGLMGASTGMQEENATVGSVAKSTGIGTAFGAVFGAIGAGLSKGFSKLASRKLTKNATEAIEKELGKLDADETNIIKESIEEGLSKDEIISDIKKSREIDVESRKELGIEDAFEEPKKPVEPTAAEYVESRKTKFREQNIPSHTRNEGKVYVPEYTRGAKNTEIDIKGVKQLQEDAMMKEVASEKALDDVTTAVEKGDVTMDEWASYNKLYEKIQKKPLTDAELLEARQILKKTGKMQSDIEAAKFAEKERIMKMVKEADKAKYRTDAEVEFKKKFKELNRATLTDNQYKEIQKLNQKIFGDDDVRIVGQIGSNRRALGKYENNVIEILDGKADAKDTFIHEAVHKYLDAFSTKEEYIAVLEKAREIYGVKGSWSEVEEELAESFIKYFKDKTKTPKSVAEFFEMMAERIKSYLKNKDEVQKLYDDILGGKAKKEASESLVQKKKKLSSLKRDRRQIIKDYLESEEGSMIVMEQQARGEIDNSYNEKVYSGIKNNPIYKKEKTVKDSMGEGYLLSKNGRYVVADAEQTAKLVDKGWKREMEIDSLANEEGFERGEDYLNSILEKAEEDKLLSSPERIAKQKLLQDDEAFSILEDEISRLNKETLPERKALADFKENLSEPKEIVGEGESKLATRINENLPEGYEIDEFYDKENIINELNKASRDIKTDKTKAIRDAFDRNTKTSQRVVKLMELAQIAKNNGDYQTVNAILSRMRQEGTETAQALNMFKAYGLSNPETEFMKRVVEARMSRFKVSMENIKKATVREVQDKLKKVASGIKEKTRKAYKIEDAQQILNKIMCK